MADINARLDALEARVREHDDFIAICQVVSAYGPCVDSLAADGAADLWTATGTYDTIRVATGHAAIAGLFKGPPHTDIVAKGSAHVMALPHVDIDGDTAVATGYSTVFVHENGEYKPWRVSANRWELVRTPRGWKVQNRLNRTLNGDQGAREILRRAVA